MNTDRYGPALRNAYSSELVATAGRAIEEYGPIELRAFAAMIDTGSDSIGCALDTRTHLMAAVAELHRTSSLHPGASLDDVRAYCTTRADEWLDPNYRYDDFPESCDLLLEFSEDYEEDGNQADYRRTMTLAAVKHATLDLKRAYPETIGRSLMLTGLQYPDPSGDLIDEMITMSEQLNSPEMHALMVRGFRPR